MRYFFSLALSKAGLPLGIGGPATTAGLVGNARSAQGFFARLSGTNTTTIDIAPITIPANSHLVMTAGTIEESGTGTHREKADECWI
jgi:hypothetical protein